MKDSARKAMMAKRNKLYKIKEKNRPSLNESKLTVKSKLFKKANNELVDIDKKLYGHCNYQKV